MGPAQPSGADRRRAERFPPQGWIAQVTMPRTWLGLAAGKVLPAPILDLSETGAKIVMTQELRKDLRVRVRIEDPKFKDVVDSPARVAWVTPPPPVANTWIIGVEFVDMYREDQLKITGWRRYYSSEEYQRAREGARFRPKP